MANPEWVLVYQPEDATRAVHERFGNSSAALSRIDALSQGDRRRGVETTYLVWRDGTIAFYGSRLPLQAGQSGNQRSVRYRG